MAAKQNVIVCVPAKNEAAALPRLLAALGQQSLPATVLLALNNSHDESVEAIELACRQFRNLRVVVDEVTFPPGAAHAGSARRRAMDIGAELAGADGILITTDADARPPPDWIAENVAALQNGLDIVGGRICLDEAADVAPAIKAMVALSDQYWTAVRAIEDDIDPVPWDLPPRHGDHTGASLAMRVRSYKESGGVPLLRTGEDRALVQAVCIHGGKLGHPPQIWTRVSARTAGRAECGMAEAMARLLNASRSGHPVMLPHFAHWETRARWRRSVREKYGSAEVAARESTLEPLPCDMPLEFGCSKIFA